MERTKHKNNKVLLTQEQEKTLHTLATTLVARNNLAGKLGMQYGGARDIYKALGYTVNPKYHDFLLRFIHQDIAQAIINRPVKATWQGPLELIESNQADDTKFEIAWKNLDKEHKLKTKLARVDRLTSIGRYGVLLLGLDDVKNQEGFKLPVKSGARQLKYVKPFGEDSARVNIFESNPTNSRYGLPLYYNIEVADTANQNSSLVVVHYSRIIHITDDSLESEVYGTPVLEAVYNRLMDVEKIVGGDAEMFWRGARPGFEGKVDKDYTMTAAAKEDLTAQVDEYENDLRRFLINEGIEIKPLQQQLTDPKSNLDAQLTLISAKTGIPKRILSGSERGELASTQDSSEWKEYVQARRDDHADPHIIRPFVDCLIELQILPNPVEEYTTKWSDLYSQSEKSRVEIGKGRASAIREYTTNPIAMELIPPAAFVEFILGLSTEQVTLITKMKDKAITEEELMKAVEGLVNPPTPPPAFGNPFLPKGKPIPIKKKPIVKIT